jgi:cytosine deaminase
VLQAEMAALENSGRLPGHVYKGATMYTTLSPCDMCSGACHFYGIARVVLGENRTRLGAEAYLQEKGIEVINMHNQACEDLMSQFIAKHPDLWCV